MTCYYAWQTTFEEVNKGHFFTTSTADPITFHFTHNLVWIKHFVSEQLWSKQQNSRLFKLYHNAFQEVKTINPYNELELKFWHTLKGCVRQWIHSSERIISSRSREIPKWITDGRESTLANYKTASLDSLSLQAPSWVEHGNTSPGLPILFFFCQASTSISRNDLRLS